MTAIQASKITVCLIFCAFAFSKHATAQDNLKEVPPSDPQYELDQLSVAEGYELNLFASDPMIEKPIQMTWDEHGRLWIIGSAVYPHLLPGREPNDKIFILEDTDGDGSADKSTVFADGLLTPTGLLVGDGGAYVANSTEILHLRDLDGDGYAEDRRVVLRGFGADDTHHIIHSFRWGPDGMMYINQSIYIFSHIETPWGVRRLRQGGIWHFRPENMKLDVLATGFVNPWGHSFDAWGQSFATDGAFHEGINHVFPAAAFVASYKAERILKGLNVDQPKHAGLAIVSGRHMPDSLQGNMISNDFRANRVNRFVITDEPDGYVSTPAGDLIWTDHVAFRPVDVSLGPDGAFYLADWYNPIIQHGEVDFRDPRRDHIHGRIWRITAKNRPIVKIPDLPNASTNELLDMLKLPEMWTHIQARRLLKEKGKQAVLPVLESWFAELDAEDNNFEQLRLEVLWLYQAFDVVNESLLSAVLHSPDFQARAAAVRVIYHWQDRLAAPKALLKNAVTDEAMRVRREAISALALLSDADAAKMAMQAIDLPMNEEVDYALWHTIRTLEPFWAKELSEDPDFFGKGLKARLFAWKAVHTPEAVQNLLSHYVDEKIPEAEAKEVLDLIVQYGDETAIDKIFELAISGDSVGPQGQIDHLQALKRGIATFDKLPTNNLDKIAPLMQHEDAGIQTIAIELAGHWQLTSRSQDILTIAKNTESNTLRRTALAAAARLNDESVRTQLESLLEAKNPTELRILAAGALITSGPEAAAPKVLNLLDGLDEQANVKPIYDAFYRNNEGRDALTEALQTNPIPAHFATAGLEHYHGNRLRDKNLLDTFKDLGGVDPKKTIDLDMGQGGLDRLELDIKSDGDPAAGEVIFRRPELACMQCHAIGGAGGQVGPDLSSVGANAPTDYIIESLIDPGKAVKDGYTLASITRTDGQVMMGTLIRNTGSSVLLRDASDAIITIPDNLIEKQEILPGSLMPAGLIAPLSRAEFVDLSAFLSRLGENGVFRLPAAHLVRHWYTPQPPSDGKWTSENIQNALSGENRSIYSRVDGSLMMSDLPAVTQNMAESLLWFELDVQSSGEINLGINSNLGIQLSVGSKNVAIENDAAIFSSSTGKQTVIVVLNRKERGDLPLIIELRQTDSSARAQLIHRASDD